MGSALPGVKVGPLDPDRTASFGTVSQRNSARQLIRFHTQAYPVALVQALAKKLDEERSLGLDMDEARQYLAGETLENGDPTVPEGASVVGASVRGDRDQTQVLTFTYRQKSGRTAKWFAAYNADVLPESFLEGSERVRVAELRKRGIVTTGDAAPDASLALENRRLREENGRLRNGDASIDAALAADEPDEDPADVIARLERERDDAVAAQAEAEDALAAREDAAEDGGEPDADGGDEEDLDDDGPGEQPAEVPAAADEPIKDYDDTRAAEVVKLLKDKDTADETRQAILDYEKTHANRRSVVGAAEQTLGARGSAE